MNYKYFRNIVLACLLGFTATACLDDLDLTPQNEFTSESLYADFNNYKSVLAKLYGGYSLTGQQGPAGNGDVQGIDEGTSSYIRTLWMLQELPTDEAKLAWVNDPGVSPLNTITWTSSNDLTRAMYYRIFYQFTLAIEFIRETSDAKLTERGITDTNLALAKTYRAEARFLRALSYWHALDLYGNVPFTTEEAGIGTFFPEQIQRADLFDYVESELLAVEEELVEARQNEYGRADKAAAWTVLAKLYLNAEVYTGQAKYTEAITYANKVINAGYTLEPEYSHLFMADNHTAEGIIFPILFDGRNTQSYGGTTFLAHAAVGGSMNAASFGLNGGWAGLRTTEAFVDKFSDISGNTDERAMFYTEGQQLAITNISTFEEGYAITKWTNVTSTGENGSDPTLTFVDTDYPMFRLADIYLTYAEAVLRGGSGGDAATALQYINLLRERAFDGTSGNVTAAQLDLDFILNERARELYWEAHRRTDLIRFGKFTDASYLWPWKGGVQEGRAVEEWRNLYPLADRDVNLNPNLEQNTGY
ncbi:MAG: RagB/SusD family nutrient uptake outer membrane protein [Bacteroidetes bacterium]|nr:RagB/SusD family nutrient uptake outer membrane protein [Bacteroidota bacterium]